MRAVPLIALLVVAGCGSAATDRSAAIGDKLNAACERSDYQIHSQLDGSKTTIYSCEMPSGKIRCVTETGGVDSDVTAQVKLLFASTLGVDNKPACIVATIP